MRLAAILLITFFTAVSPALPVADTDGDGVPDGSDNSVSVYNSPQADPDDDGIGDACARAIDGDGFANASDALPYDTTEHLDADSDGVGDNADPDDDNDGVPDTSDNCRTVANPSQANYDGDT